MARLVVGTSKAKTVPAIIKGVPMVMPLTIQKTKDANGKVVNGTSIIDLDGATDVGNYALTGAYRSTSFPAGTNVDFSSLTTISGGNACNYMFYDCTGLASVDLSSLQTVSGSHGCNSMFYNSSITSIDLSSLTSISGSNGMAYFCNGCTHLSGTIDLSSLRYVDGSAYSMFAGCSGITGVNLSALESVSGSMNGAFEGCTGLTSIDLSSLLSATGSQSLCNMFKSCTSLVSVDLSSLTTLSSSQGMISGFQGCSSLTSVDFSSVCNVSGAYLFQNAFYDCTSLTSLSFPSLGSSSFGYSKNQFNSMLQSNKVGFTIHFPSNIQSTIEGLTGYPNFGGTDTVILFDLPATNTLTGADTVIYTRNPKYDTATALAWKVGAYGTTNFTPAYYTSGTTDPTVGTTIYSDAACTTTVTTVASIA